LDIAFPFRLNSRGRIVTSDYEGHIRPDFGSGLMQLTFSPGSEELVAATQFLVQSSLQQWLGDLIYVEEVAIESIDSTLNVSVRYLILQNKSRQVAQFKYGV
jgi:phage baseplate assembly protein W